MFPAAWNEYIYNASHSQVLHQFDHADIIMQTLKLNACVPSMPLKRTTNYI